MSSPRRVFAALAIALLLGCGSGDQDAAEDRPAAAVGKGADAALSTRVEKVSAPAARRAGERPMPGFEGRTLDGKSLSVRSLIGRRFVLFFFNPEIEESAVVARAVGAVAAASERYNFRVVGVAVGSNGDAARRFAQAHELEFPILDDSSARISNTVGLRQPLLLIGADSEGYMSFGISGFATEGADASHRIEQDLRERLRLPSGSPVRAGALLGHPEAPLFTAERLDRSAKGEPFELAALRGKPVVLIFFLHTCPHCHHALEFLKGALPKIPEAQRPQLLGISLVDRPSAVRNALEELELDFFPVLRDGDEKVRQAYAVHSGVPDIVLIDRSGQIVHRSNGWRDRDEPILRMQLARIAGTKVPMLLSRKGYTGNDVCGVCHELELASWQYTQHASAYDTLVTHAAERDAECVSCHVVGFGGDGGWSFEEPLAHMEDVGCETCHGRGGPHLSPAHVTGGDYEAVCKTCHNPTHSLGFDYASFRPQISHTAIAALTPEQREVMLAGRSKPRDVLPTTAPHVGSAVCQSCHATEFSRWSASPHAAALATLEADGKDGDASCLACHTTAFGKEGGFPSDGAPADHPDLASVGCESCHGPGGDHVKDGAKKLGSIVSLGDKCDSCVILQICGSCHDHENDPDFEFNVQEHIDRQRHGTIEAGTGKPLDTAFTPSERRGDADLRRGVLRALAHSGAQDHSAHLP